MPFANYQEMYRQKLTTADEAVKVIKSGDWVDYGFCAIHPRVLDEALARRAPELEDVKVRGGISLWKPAIFDIEDPVHHIIFNSHHMSSVERHHIASGAGFHEPMRYSELPRYYYDHITPPDVAMFQVTPMDKHGYFNFGLSAWVSSPPVLPPRWSRRWPSSLWSGYPTAHVSSWASAACLTPWALCSASPI